MALYIMLTGYYLPNPGATGMCVHQIAKELKLRGNRVITIAYKDYVDEEQLVDQVEVERIETPYYLRDNKSANSIQARLKQIASLFSKLIHIRNYPLRSSKMIQRYVKAVSPIIEANKEEKITVLASLNPLEAVVAATRIKQKYGNEIQTVYYCADTLSNEKGDDGILSAEYRTKCGLRWEKKLFAAMDKIIIMECHKSHYISNEFKDFQNKMVTANFPLFSRMEESEDVNSHFSRDVVYTMCYAGTLYRTLRNPEYLLKLLCQLNHSHKIEAIFLGSNDCEDLTDKACELSNGAVKYVGMQPHNIALQYLNEAAVLLSIGNAESPMAPSKIYEYMSTGKPIIHVYSWDKDPCLAPLCEYGNALILKDGDVKGVEKLEKFLDCLHTVPFQDVEKKFITATPGYTASIIENPV